FPHAGHTQLFLTTPGTTLDGIAKEMFAEGPHRTKRAVLIHNNPDLIACLETNRVPAKKNVDIRVSA
ncbi:MAG: hypothetical protein KJP07_04105, partial [Desulfatitalea sp.]|nr:hypothetical protein [Desulfatitalea sp.]